MSDDKSCYIGCDFDKKWVHSDRKCNSNLCLKQSSVISVKKQNSLWPCPKCVSSCRELLSKLSLREVVKSREVVLSLTGFPDNLLN